MIEPSKPAKNTPVLAWCERLWDYMRSERIIAGPGLESRKTSSGNILSVMRQGSGTAPDAVTPACPFGEIAKVDGNTVIRGGPMMCGDQNYNIADRVIDLEAEGSWLIQITLSGIDPATDDDEEIFLGGVITASGTPAWGAVAYSGSEDYTANTNPADPSSTGTIVVPIGILSCANNRATLVAAGCGGITVSQCGGILSFTRG